jgi:Rieske Fe-S protein
MERRDFIRSCGFVCLGGIAFATVIQSCSTTKRINGTIAQSNLVVDLREFQYEKKGQMVYHKYLIVQNDALKFPICIYRFSDTDFTALYMECTHQGAELQVFGDKIQCPAHGSEFSSRGQVESGPATNKLRTFPVQILSQQLNISLT